MKIGQYSIFMNFFEKIPDKLITNGCIGARMKIFLNVIGWGEGMAFHRGYNTFYDVNACLGPYVYNWVNIESK